MAISILSHADIVRIARDVSVAHNPHGAYPVDIESIIDVGYGIDIMPRDGLMDRFQIDAYITRDLTEIVVDKRIYEQRPPNRYRFSLAQEFAHLVLHTNVYQSMLFNTTAEWKQAMASLAADDYRWLEWQANAFNGVLLVPPGPLRIECGRIRQQMIDGGVDPDRLDEQGVDRVMRLLGQTFGVSTKVVNHRVRKDGLWIFPP
ncbi:MAG TPA: ImmA/IrrE family metallo-endopeptidase [Tepidisphaeraceae bacterium]|jgi:Zn-dependent peptidase ImmA (M78 family)|nr:ImmA/IrrE family metallo-endopeptidase [Tepidisphaeraceae bacterium]